MEQREKRLRDQEAYRKYLETQMKEIKDRQELENREINRFLEEQRARLNAGDFNEDQKVKKIDLFKSQITFGYWI